MPSTSIHNIDDYESLRVALQDALGVIVPDEQRRHLVEKVEPLLAEYQLDSLAMLAEKLRDDNAEVRTNVLDVISRRQSSWMINTEIKNILHNYIFAQLPGNARIWVVGCGQGQLAYSIAMEMANYEHRSGESCGCKIIATDVLQDDIKHAESASYSSQQLSTLSDENKKLYVNLDEKAGTGQVKDKIRQTISFCRYDIIEDLQPLGQMDLIICPDVLAYFSNGIRAGVLKQMVALLKSGGIFVVGGSQYIPPDQGLERVDHSAGIFYRQINQV